MPLPPRRGPSGGADRGNAGRRGGGAVPLGDVLRDLARELRLEERSRGGAVAGAWERVAGEDLAERARPVSLRGGVLTVEVEGAALLQEMRQFRAADLLAALRTEPGAGDVREVKFVPAGRARRG